MQLTNRTNVSTCLRFSVCVFIILLHFSYWIYRRIFVLIRCVTIVVGCRDKPGIRAIGHMLITINLCICGNFCAVEIYCVVQYTFNDTVYMIIVYIWLDFYFILFSLFCVCISLHPIAMDFYNRNENYRCRTKMVISFSHVKKTKEVNWANKRRMKRANVWVDQFKIQIVAHFAFLHFAYKSDTFGMCQFEKVNRWEKVHFHHFWSIKYSFLAISPPPIKCSYIVVCYLISHILKLNKQKLAFRLGEIFTHWYLWIVRDVSMKMHHSCSRRMVRCFGQSVCVCVWLDTHYSFQYIC